MLAGLVSPEASPLGLWTAAFSCVLTRSLLCAHVPDVPSSCYKDTSHIGLGPIMMTSFYFNYLFKDPVSKYSHTLQP